MLHLMLEKQQQKLFLAFLQIFQVEYYLITNHQEEVLNLLAGKILMELLELKKVYKKN